MDVVFFFQASGNKVSRHSVLCGSQNIVLNGKASIKFRGKNCYHVGENCHNFLACDWLLMFLTFSGEILYYLTLQSLQVFSVIMYCKMRKLS